MATGYDNRETTRQSFAFAPRQGRQTRNDVAASPTMGRQGSVGGSNTASVVQSQNPTLGNDPGAGIPAFLEQVFEPVIKARQQERVRAGYAAAVNGESLADIAERQPGMAAIFGPTDFQRGAEFFAAQTAVNQWEADQLSNMSKLREIPEEDLGKYLNDAANSFMTGDVFADNAINAAILEKTAVLIPRIAQARVEWQQQTLARGARDRATSAGSGYEALVRSYTTQPELVEGETDPLAGQRIDAPTLQRGKESFLSSFLPIAGMTPEGYRSFVKDTARGFLASGNLWAFNAMNEGGHEGLLFSTLEADDFATLQSAYTTAGKAAQARALMQVGPEYDLLRTRVALQQVKPKNIRGELDKFNVRIAALSGFPEPFFDAEDMIRQTEDGVTDLIKGWQADQQRLYQENRDVLNRQADAAMKQQQEDRALAEIQAMASIGDLQAAEFMHGENKVNMVMTAAIRQDPATAIPLLVRSHQNNSAVITGVKDILTSQVTANIAMGYESQAFQNAFTNWKTFDRTQGGTAARAAYYGQYDLLFSEMEKLRAGGTDGTVAFANTFGQAGALAGTAGSSYTPTPEQANQLNAAFDKIGPDFLTRVAGGRRTNNANAMIERLALNGAAARMQANPSLDPKDAAQAELSALMADNRIEVVGRDAWANPARGPSMGSLTGVPADRIGSVWNSLVDEGLARVNARGRAYTVWRSGTGPGSRWIVNVDARNGGDSEAFEINVPMITTKDTITERADVRRRRSATQNNAEYVRQQNLPINRDGPTPRRSRQPDLFEYDRD